MIRTLALVLFLLASPVVFAASATSAPPAAPPSVTGVVADPSGAIVPGAEIDLVDTDGTLEGSFHSSDDGSFQIVPPHAGSFTLVVSEPGFETIKTPFVVAAPAAVVSGATGPARFAAPLHITLPIAAFATNVRVNADSDQDLTASDENHDSSVMTSQELKSLPIFDNDYAGAMSAFLDDSSAATGGSGLIVDGVEANRFGRAGSPHQPGPILRAVLLAWPRSNGNHHQVRRRPLPRPVQFPLPRLGIECAKRACAVQAI